MGLGAFGIGFSQLTKFELHEVTVPVLPKGTLRGETEFRILHVSDLHMLDRQRAKQEWVAGLAGLDPHLVVNTGDNLGETGGVPGVLRALGPLLTKPGLFVFGTNDYFGPKPVNPFGYLLGKKRKPSKVELPWRGMRAAFLEHGWVDLNNKRHEFQVGRVRIAAAGVDDPHHNYEDTQAIKGAPHPEADLELALLHSPEPRVLDFFDESGYRLALAGHTHGGQICLPGGKPIVTNCGIDPDRARGLSRYKHLWLHVSNGLGTSKYAPVRLFCKPSATLLRLVEEQ